jgi:hypothetical protein
MSKRGPNGKASSSQDKKTVKLTLTLPIELAQKFGVHAEMTGVGKSELFEELVKNGCRRYTVSDREKDKVPGKAPEADAGKAP